MEESELLCEFNRLESQIKSESNLNRMAFPLRDKLYHKSIQLLQSDPLFSFENSVLPRFWKLGVYDRIDYFKKGITHFQRRKNVKSEQQIRLSCQNFLKKAIDSFSTLLDYFLKLARLSETKNGSISDDLDNIQYYKTLFFSCEECGLMRRSLWFCYQVCVYLGDLERYSQLFVSNGVEKDWSKASYFYRLAVSLSPEEGKGFNQLALLSSMSQNFLSTAYYYVRSLEAKKKPFTGAEENLRSLLERNHKNFKFQYQKSRNTYIEKYISEVTSLRLVFSAILYFFQCIRRNNSETLLASEVESFQSLTRSILKLSEKHFFDALYSKSITKENKSIVKNILFEVFILSLHLFQSFTTPTDCKRKKKKQLTSNGLEIFLWILSLLRKAMASKGSIDLFFLISLFSDYCLADDLFYDCLLSHSGRIFCSYEKKTRKKFWLSFASFTTKLRHTKKLEKLFRNDFVSQKETRNRIHCNRLTEEIELCAHRPFSDIYEEYHPKFRERRAFGADLKSLQSENKNMTETNTKESMLKRVQKILDLVRRGKTIRFNQKQNIYEVDEKILESFSTEIDTEKGPQNDDLKTDETLNWRASETIKHDFKDNSVEKVVENILAESLEEFSLNEKRTDTVATKNSVSLGGFDNEMLTGESVKDKFPSTTKTRGIEKGSKETVKPTEITEETGPKRIHPIDSLSVRFTDTSKLERDLLSNGYSTVRAAEIATRIKKAVEKMHPEDFEQIESRTVQFRPYYEAERDAVRHCQDINNELRAFTTENMQTALECQQEIRRARRILANTRKDDVKERARQKLDHYEQLETELNAKVKKLNSEEKNARTELDRAHFLSFAERRKVYHPELNLHMIDHERFRNLIFVDVEERQLGERLGERVAMSLSDTGEIHYHAFIKDHKYSYVPTAPKSVLVLDSQERPEEDWREEFR